MKKAKLFLTVLILQVCCLQNMNADKNTLKGVIFDCDGTLIDSEYFHFLSWQKAMEKRGASLTMEEYFSLSGKSVVVISEQLHERAQADSADAICKDKQENYRQMQKEGVNPIVRTVNLVKQFAERKEELGIRLALASAGFKEEILINLAHLGLSDAFDAIISGMDDLDHTAEEGGLNKPKPHIYIKAAELLGLEPETCVAFEDSSTGVLAATRAGIMTFALPNSFTLHHDFSPAACVIDPEQNLEVNEVFEMFNNQTEH